MTALETCVYCPKLCRSECPVSNAEPRETLTPWGKMSMTHFVATERVPATASFAHVAWACTGCGACAEACDHNNDVAGTLLDARAAMSDMGLRHPGASKVIADTAARTEATRKAIRALSDALPDYVDSKSDLALLVGCAACRHAPEEAKSAIRVASRLAKKKVRLVDECCGSPLEAAGDREAFKAQASRFAKSVADAKQLWVVDPGCAVTLRQGYAGIDRELPTRPDLLVEEAARRLTTFATTPVTGSFRYHDPCKLGRGLGVFDAPRALLGRVLGKAPDEFRLKRERGTCSGGGSLLPQTHPTIAHNIAQDRVAQHEDSGGGTVVTACAGSQHRLRKGGAEVVDLYALLDRASDPERRA